MVGLLTHLSTRRDFDSAKKCAITPSGQVRETGSSLPLRPTARPGPPARQAQGHWHRQRRLAEKGGIRTLLLRQGFAGRVRPTCAGPAVLKFGGSSTGEYQASLFGPIPLGVSRSVTPSFQIESQPVPGSPFTIPFDKTPAALSRYVAQAVPILIHRQHNTTGLQRTPHPPCQPGRNQGTELT